MADVARPAYAGIGTAVVIVGLLLAGSFGQQTRYSTDPDPPAVVAPPPATAFAAVTPSDPAWAETRLAQIACLSHTDPTRHRSTAGLWRSPDAVVAVIGTRFARDDEARAYLRDARSCPPINGTLVTPPALPDAVEKLGTLRTPSGDIPVAEATLRRGTDVMHVEAATASDPHSLVIDVTRAELVGWPDAEPYPDAFGAPQRIGESLPTVAAAAALAVAILIIVLELLDRSAERSRRRRHPAESDAEPLFVDVSSLAVAMKRGARREFIADLAFVVAFLYGIPILAVAPVLALVYLTIVSVIAAGRVWHRKRSRPGGPGLRRPSSVLPAVSALVTLAGLAGSLWLVVGAVDDEFQGSPELLLRGSYGMPAWSATLGLALLALTTIPWRLTLRLCRAEPPPDAGAEDSHAVLYLRSFSDDGLTISVAPYARTSLLERFSGRRGQNFEEILAEEAQTHAPVLAVNQPGRRLTPIGFVRQSFDADEWQEKVTGHMRSAVALLIVLGSGAGLDWEIRTLDRLDAWDKAIIVIPPVPANGLAARWAHLATLCRDVGVTPPPMPAEPPVLLALSRTDDGEWLHHVGAAADAWHVKAALAGALVRRTTGRHLT